MKRLLSIFLCCLLILTSLVACDNNTTENSREVSSQQDISNEVESSTENSSIAESSEETSQEPEPYISEIPENAVYFTSDYTGTKFSERERIFDNNRFLEYYSCITDNGLKSYFENNEVSDDTYFLVGMVAFTELIDYDYVSYLNAEEGRALMRTILKPYDFIEWENHKMLYNRNFTIEYGDLRDEYWSGDDIKTDSETVDEYMGKVYGVLKKFIKQKFPDLELIDVGNPEMITEHEDVMYYYYWNLLTYRFDVIGYISAKDLKQLNEDLKDGEQVVGITWFPAPDDQERWLTANPYYKPED